MISKEFHGLNEYINYFPGKSPCLFKGYLKVDCYLSAYIQQIYLSLMNAFDLFIGAWEKNNRTKVNLDLYNKLCFFLKDVKGH